MHVFLAREKGAHRHSQESSEIRGLVCRSKEGEAKVTIQKKEMSPLLILPCLQWLCPRTTLGALACEDCGGAGERGATWGGDWEANNP